MSRRYKDLPESLVFSAFNEVRNSLLAAKDGNDVEEIIKALLTLDERIKIGRRVEIAYMLNSNLSYDEIKRTMSVGFGTISSVEKALQEHKKGFELIFERSNKVQSEFENKAYKKVGGPKLVNKKTKYTGFRRKDVKR